ncbi:MAG: hypothetical protein U1E36_04245 [Rickettsiales bacterium]
MKRTLMQRIYLLYLIIFFEGFTVLGAELTAIRQLLPFVGGATDIVAIVIAAVLVPLAFGYEAGGRYRKSKSFRKRLLINMTVAAIFLSIGLSYIVLEIFFSLLIVMHITHPLIQTILYCAIFLVTPIYLLGQTIPLCMHFLPKGNQSKSTGLVLVFSTVGSFLGSIVSTLVIMPFFGVNIVVITLCGILLLMLFLLLKDKMDFYLVISGMFFTGIKKPEINVRICLKNLKYYIIITSIIWLPCFLMILVIAGY